jgi:hypothetical protein
MGQNHFTFNHMVCGSQELGSARLYVALQRARQRRCLCTPAGVFAPLHPRREVFLPLDPDHIHGGQPCADWMRAKALPPWTGTRVALPPRPPRQDFRIPTPATGGLRAPGPRPAERRLDPRQERLASWTSARELSCPLPHDRQFAAGLRRTCRRSIPSRSEAPAPDSGAQACAM